MNQMNVEEREQKHLELANIWFPNSRVPTFLFTLISTNHVENCAMNLPTPCMPITIFDLHRLTATLYTLILYFIPVRRESLKSQKHFVQSRSKYDSYRRQRNRKNATTLQILLPRAVEHFFLYKYPFVYHVTHTRRVYFLFDCFHPSM